MTTIQDAVPSPSVEAVQPPMPDNTPAQPERRRLRLYLVGSREDTQSAIDCLHMLGYAKRFEWSPVITIPEHGLIIRSDPGDVLRYLQREIRRSPGGEI